MVRRMFDSIDVLSLPAGADLYAGYDDGNWPDADAIAAAHPGKTVVRFTVNPADDEGDCLDVEKYDANPVDAPPWIRRRRSDGHLGPLVYFSEANRVAVVEAFRVAGVPLPGAIVASYPGPGAVITPGDVGHQWVDHGPYDESVVVDYLPGIDPAPAPAHIPQPSGAIRMFTTDPVTGGVWATDENGDLFALFGAPSIPGAGLNQHPDLHAGTEESGGAAPCVGIEYWGRPGGEDGIVYFTRPAGGSGGIPGTPYSAYRWRRNGTPA